MGTSKTLTITSKNSQELIDIKKIQFIKGNGDESEIVTTDITYFTNDEWETITSQLPKGLFKRVHDDFIINIFNIDTISLADSEVRVSNETIPIGPIYKADLIEDLNFLT